MTRTSAGLTRDSNSCGTAKGRATRSSTPSGRTPASSGTGRAGGRRPSLDPGKDAGPRKVPTFRVLVLGPQLSTEPWRQCCNWRQLDLPVELDDGLVVLRQANTFSSER